MKRISACRFGFLLAVPFLAGSCGGDDGPIGPTNTIKEGQIQVWVDDVPANAEAVSLRIVGDWIGNLALLGSGYSYYSADSQEGKRVIVLGPLSSGALLSFRVPDISKILSYDVQVAALAASDYSLLSPSSITFSLK